MSPHREFQHPSQRAGGFSREQERLDLERELAEHRCQIEDLRAFEADYRARMIAYHEDCLRKLRAGE